MKDTYVLIDWHDHRSELYMDQAKEFLTETASKYDNYAHDIFETYNGSLAVSWTGVIKSSCQQLVPIVR